MSAKSPYYTPVQEPHAKARGRAERMLLMFANGMTIRQIADQEKLRYHTVYDILNYATKHQGWVRQAIDSHKSSRRSIVWQRYKDMAAMRAEGKTLQEIGNHYGISRERVRQLLLKLTRR